MGRELPIFEPPNASAHHTGTAGLSIALGGGPDFGGGHGADGKGPDGHPLDGTTALRRHPRLDQGPDPVRRELPRSQGPPPGPFAEHRLRGGPLPEHRRVLGPAHRHDHDPGRHLHPGLRLLRGQDRPADLVRRRRAAAGGRGARQPRPRARRDHQRRPRRPARWRGRDLRRDDPPGPRSFGRDGRRGPDPGLQRHRRAPAHGDGRPAGHPEPQPRDGRAAPEAGPQAGPLRPQPVGPRAGQGLTPSPTAGRSTPSRA